MVAQDNTPATPIGLVRYGYHADANRIAGKDCAAQDALFDSTGQLWEKIDGENGETAGGEYEAEPMLARCIDSRSRYPGACLEHCRDSSALHSRASPLE